MQLYILLFHAMYQIYHIILDANHRIELKKANPEITDFLHEKDIIKYIHA